MSNTAFQLQYRQEFIAGFEQGQSLLRSACVTESVIKGNQAVFLVADTGNAAAVTRGVNGLIPGRADNLNQYTATLQEWHDKPRRTGFNIFASQGDGRRIMQETTIKVMNRKIDQDILGELANASNNTGTATTASLSLVMKAQAILGKNEVAVDEEENMFFVASPAFRAYLMQTKEFGSRDWVDMNLPFIDSGADLGVNGTRKVERWAGFNWIWHPRLSGAATSAEKCFAFHKDAIGHAVNTGEMDVKAGYNEEDDYYFARSTIFMGSKLLQTKGVVVVNHDGSAY